MHSLKNNDPMRHIILLPEEKNLSSLRITGSFLGWLVFVDIVNVGKNIIIIAIIINDLLLTFVVGRIVKAAA